MTARTEEVKRRVRQLTDTFDSFVEAYDTSSPFTSAQCQLHRQTIDRRRDLGFVSKAILDDEFLTLLRETLASWGLDVRGSRLSTQEELSESLRSHLQELEELEPLELESPDLNIAITTERLWALIEALTVTENKAKVVASTKLLHHLLPHLVPPMDRAYTGAFFDWPPPYFQYRQRQIFDEAFGIFASIARATQPSRLVGEGWRTGPAKIVDNALIAYCRLKKTMAADSEPALLTVAEPSDTSALGKLAGLLAEANRVNARIAELLDRPVERGHIGEFIASEVFDIQLEMTAVQAGFDGRFRSGPFAGKSVNVKFYGRLENVLDIGQWRPDTYLVMTGPGDVYASSRGQTRPWGIEKVFLFETQPLISALTERGVKLGVATSVRRELWDRAQIFPEADHSIWRLTDEQTRLLNLFVQERLT